MNSSESSGSVYFSAYLLPSAFAVINLVACLIALLVSTFNRSMLHTSWNTLYQLTQNAESKFIYIIRVDYFYRKSSIDFRKTCLTIQLATSAQSSDVNDICKVRVPAKFFEHNKHNTFNRDQGTIKFLLIRDAELKLIEKVSLTHDYPGGELNVSLVDIHNCTSNEGYIACVEHCIKSLQPEAMDKEQTFMATSQANMNLEGDFAISQGISPLEFISPLYLLFSVVSYYLAIYLLNYFTNYTIKQSYTNFNSIRQGIAFSLGYSFLIFGLMFLAFEFTKYILDGKPSSRFGKVFHGYESVCVLVGIIYALMTVSKLDPEQLQYSMKDANLVPHYLRVWAESTMYAMGTIILFVIPLFLIVFIFMSMIFK